METMNLREIADYKETYSQTGAKNIIDFVEAGLKEIGKLLNKGNIEEVMKRIE